MKNLIIVGAGDSGREIFSWASPYFSKMGFCFKGYIDDNHADAIATIKAYQPLKDDIFVNSIGSPVNRMRSSHLLRERQAEFINLIHPSAIVLSELTESGIVIAPFVYISNNVLIEKDVFINASSTIGHDVRIGESSVLCAQVDITGHVILGKKVFIGSQACIIPKRQIGDDAIIGAGSAVMRNVPTKTTVVGVPAKRLI